MHGSGWIAMRHQSADCRELDPYRLSDRVGLTGLRRIDERVLANACALDARTRRPGRVARGAARGGLVPEYPWEPDPVIVNGRQVRPLALIDVENPESWTLVRGLGLLTLECWAARSPVAARVRSWWVVVDRHRGRGR